MYFRHLQGRPRGWRPGEGWARVRVLAVVVADGQKLVFVGFSGEGEREFEQDIYVMNEDGTGVERVTRSRAYEASPSFFPDGQRIAFARYSRNDADIFTKTLGVPGSTRLTDTPAFEDSVAVSPDGLKIAFTKFSRSVGSSDVYVMDAAGTGTENITDTRRIDEFGTDWSPDGQRIAFTSIRFIGQDGPAARAAGSQEDGAFTPEALTPESPARGPAGSKETSAVPEESIEVSVINTDGSGRENLTAGPAYDVLPAFSPSGDQIVFSKVTFDGRTERSDLFVMGSDGANKTQGSARPRAPCRPAACGRG
jgi:Tol biopolymer transport system component